MKIEIHNVVMFIFLCIFVVSVAILLGTEDLVKWLYGFIYKLRLGT